MTILRAQRNGDALVVEEELDRAEGGDRRVDRDVRSGVLLGGQAGRCRASAAPFLTGWLVTELGSFGRAASTVALI